MSIIENRMRIAVVGCGYWGINLVRNFQELGVLELVCDQSKSSLNKAKQISPLIKTTSKPLD